MFDRFARLTQARRALAAARLEEALRLLDDPLIATHRRAEDLRLRVLAALVARAKLRASERDFAAAQADVRTVLRWQPEHAEARALEPDLRQAVTAVERTEGEAQQTLRQARRLLDAGDLVAAEARLDAIGVRGAIEVECRVLRKAIASRRATAARLCQQARQAFTAGQMDAARDLVRQGLGLDRTAPGGIEVRREIAVAVGRAVGRAVQEDLRAGAASSACERLVIAEAGCPELAEVGAFAAARKRAEHALRASIERELRAGRVREAISLFGALDQRVRSMLGDFAEAMAVLDEAVRASEAGDVVTAASHYATIAKRTEFAAVRDTSQRAQADAAEIAEAIEAARSRSASGDMVAARRCLEPAMARWPMVRCLHDEMRLIDDGVLERQTRLTAVRQLASEGKLREACALAMALASPGDTGDDARRLQAELQAKIDLVANGIDQIKRAMHGRGSGSAEGLAHCVARIDELAKLQSDHAEIPRLRAALLAERRGLELVQDAVATCTGGRLSTELAEVGNDLLQLRRDLLRDDRLDAHLLRLADAAAARGEAECAKGRLRDAELCCGLLASLRPIVVSIGQRADELARRIAEARARARAAVERGRSALATRQLGAAESAFDLAHQCAMDDDEVRALGRDIESLRAHGNDLAEVESMTAKRDFTRAHERLATMSPTPAALRTKIFDLKQSLARAQGLDGGFVLRVDEGGEYLVMRRESVSIGNLRDGRADLVVLANISGQHARFQRRMSFHGGLEDRIVAERGEVLVNGARVREHHLRDGDEVSLGGQLRLAYRVPSSRSLTVAVRLLGGFQVRGTDRILLMKDRGRDGRILIGRAPDAHVRVAIDGPEVELFAGLDGQIRVRCESGGSMDGRPFSGEHPVSAGAAVTCGGISFVLLPLGTS